MLTSFLSAISSSTFLTNAIITGILSSIICGISGTFVVIKKISYISGGIAHAVMGGIGLAYYLGVSPLLGAFVSAIISAIIIGLVSLKAKEYEDTIIGAIWATGMAVGIIFMHLTPGYNVDLMSLLFGNILMISSSQISILLILNILIIGITFLFYRHFVAISFDDEFCEIRGLRVELYFLLMLVMIAISVVVLIQSVGLILLIALLTLPANIGSQFAKTPFFIMVIATILGMFFTLGGIALSYSINLPSGAMIILLASTTYFISLLGKPIVKKLKKN